MQRLVLACAFSFALPYAAIAEEPAPPPSPPEPTVEKSPETAPPPPAPTPSPVIEERTAVKPAPKRQLMIDVPGERSRNNKLFVGGLLAAGVIASGLGVYWHLDSRDASDAVASDEFTGEAWTDDKVALVDRAERSRTRAIVAYSIGGAFLIGTLVAYIITDPKSETAIIQTGAIVAPTTDGGAMVSKAWSF